MAKICPLSKRYVLYLDCMECDEKECRNLKKSKYNKVVIGIDQSYKNTGISIAVDGQIKTISNYRLDCFNNNSEKREKLSNKLQNVFQKYSEKSRQQDFSLCVIIERIRLLSQGFLNIDYIKSIGALNALIIDVAYQYDIPVYSVDTRAWKSQIIGTSKPKNNKYKIDPNKWPTILWLIQNGYEDQILRPVSNRKKNGIVKIIDGQNYTYDDDAADSACIALYGFVDEKLQHLKEEK
jgi:hypothetical protein